MQPLDEVIYLERSIVAALPDSLQLRLSDDQEKLAASGRTDNPEAYRRYLINRFRKAFRLQGTPVRLAFKTGDNPYKDKRNKLTPRQERKRKRLMKHVRK